MESHGADMGVSQEIELKLVFDPAEGEKLRGAGFLASGTGPSQRLAATYFDTPDQMLRAAGFSLRLRREDDRQVQTVKASGSAAGLFVRTEWERAVSGDSPVLDPETDPLHKRFPADRLAALRPMFRTVVMRDRRVVEQGGARIEVAIDNGEVIAGDSYEPLCELELELLSGPAHALFDAARALDAIVPLRLSVLTKSERGYRLADKVDRTVAKAEPVDLSGAADIPSALGLIARNCIRQIRLNEDIFLSSGSPASLHQLRVGIRRLRSALFLFRPIVRNDPRYRPIFDGLRELATVMGAVRDLDVLIARCGPRVQEELATAREEAREKAVMTLGLASTRHLMLDLAQWLALGEWQARAAAGKWANQPPVEFAAHALRRCRRRLKRAGESWTKLDCSHRHMVRKEAKKLRYSVEFFASLFTGDKAEHRRAAFRDALEDLQDDLGALNDLAVAPELLARLGMADALPEPSRRKQQAMIDSAGRKLSTLLATKGFWG
ncbi:MAG: CHAD domain-containing protein [Sphingobium sp.]